MSEMNDRQFIGYCRLHCTTERGLFVGAHINRILDLAGRPARYDQIQIPPKNWYGLDEGYMLPLCDLADERLRPLPLSS